MSSFPLADTPQAAPTCASVLIELIDEVTRLRGRVFAAHAHAPQTMGGLQWLVLSAVVAAREAPTVARIGRSLGHPRQSIQRLADELVQRGLIAQQPNPEHARARLLVPTESGRALHAAQTLDSLHWAARIVGGLDPIALDQTVATLREVRQRIEAEHRQILAQGLTP